MGRSNQVIKPTPSQNLFPVKPPVLGKILTLERQEDTQLRKCCLHILHGLLIPIECCHCHAHTRMPTVRQRRMIGDSIDQRTGLFGRADIIDNIAGGMLAPVGV